jgi:hypothetical protein
MFDFSAAGTYGGKKRGAAGEQDDVESQAGQLDV